MKNLFNILLLVAAFSFMSCSEKAFEIDVDSLKNATLTIHHNWHDGEPVTDLSMAKNHGKKNICHFKPDGDLLQEHRDEHNRVVSYCYGNWFLIGTPNDNLPDTLNFVIYETTNEEGERYPWNKEYKYLVCDLEGSEKYLKLIRIDKDAHAENKIHFATFYPKE